MIADKFTEVSLLIVLLLIVGVVVAIKLNQSRPMLPNTSSAPQVELPLNYHNGSWLWVSPLKLDQSKRQQLLDFCQHQHLNNIYLEIDDYIDIYEQPDKAKKQVSLDQFNQSVSHFITEAKAKNIKVYALAGNTLWANSDYDYIPPLILDYAQKNNFDGIYYDIEFYNQSNFNQAVSSHSQEYLGLVNKLVNQLQASPSAQPNFVLGFDIPYWFGNEKGLIPAQTWKGVKKPLGFHLLDILDQYLQSVIVIMAYRNKVSGDNGSIAVSQDLANYTTQTKNVNYIIGLDISQAVKSDALYAEDRQTVKKAALEVINSYQDKPHFKGIAIHHLINFNQLKDY